MWGRSAARSPTTPTAPPMRPAQTAVAREGRATTPLWRGGGPSLPGGTPGSARPGDAPLADLYAFFALVSRDPPLTGSS